MISRAQGYIWRISLAHFETSQTESAALLKSKQEIRDTYAGGA